MIQDTVTLEQSTVLRRIHDSERDPLVTDAHNDPPVQRRFSPLGGVGGLYLAETFEAAACETLLRYAASASERYPVIRSKLKRTVVTQVQVARDLTLVAVEDAILRNLQQCTPVIPRTRWQMTLPPQDDHESPINCGPNRYGYSQEAAQVLREAFPDANGLRWPSRHLSSRHCVVLWDDRVTPSIDLTPSPSGPEPLHQGVRFRELRDLVYRLNFPITL